MGDERGRQHRNQAAGQRWQKLGTFQTSPGPLGIAFDGANIWTANRGSGTVTKLRASDGSLLGTFNTPLEPYGIAFDGTDIWVTGLYVYELRASDGAILGRLVPGTNTIGAAFDGANIWIAGLNDNSVGKL